MACSGRGILDQKKVHSCRYCCKRCQQKAEEYAASQKRKTKELVERNREMRRSFLAVKALLSIPRLVLWVVVAFLGFLKDNLMLHGGAILTIVFLAFIVVGAFRGQSLLLPRPDPYLYQPFIGP